MIDAEQRLRNEKQLLKSELPSGFFARPVPLKVNNAPSKTELDYFTWICGIPGRPYSLYDGSTLLLYMFFPYDYPKRPPKCYFEPPLFHPNVYPSGSICLSLINEATWKPDVSIKAMLMGIYILLDEPNIASPAQQEAYSCLKTNKTKYNQTVREFAAKYPSYQFQERVMKLVRSGEYRTSVKHAAATRNNEYYVDFD